jgi:hypothetical protein
MLDVSGLRETDTCLLCCVVFCHPLPADGAPVVPISAQLKYNVDVVCEFIEKRIPVPVRDFLSPPQMIVIRWVGLDVVDAAGFQGLVISPAGVRVYGVCIARTSTAGCLACASKGVI